LSRKIFLNLGLFCLLITNQSLQAQWYNNVPQDLMHVYRVGRDLARAPLDFDRHDWAGVGLTTAGTLALFSVDKCVQSYALDHQSRTGDMIFRLDKYYGNEKTIYYCAGIYGFGLLAGNSEIRRLGLRAAEAVAFSNLLTSFFKSTLGRRRPYAGQSNLFFAPMRGGEVYHSLPSGHATASFAFATVLADYKPSWCWRTFWYSSAFVIAGARLYHNKHWISDVFAGGIIGYSFGKFIANYDRREVKSVARLTPEIKLSEIRLVYRFD